MKTSTGRRWVPAAILGVGCLLSLGAGAQITPELRLPLASALPDSIGGTPGIDVKVSKGEAAVAGFTNYALRAYQSSDTLPATTIYLGYYDHQTRGHTIHSPKNCLPGSGWEVLSDRAQPLVVGDDTVTVNRYLLQNEGARDLVLYWYQGRGRVAYDEYLVKWDLLRDAILKRRTDEALVRVVVPITGSEDQALARAKQIAVHLVPAVYRVLPS